MGGNESETEKESKEGRKERRLGRGLVEKQRKGYQLS